MASASSAPTRLPGEHQPFRQPAAHSTRGPLRAAEARIDADAGLRKRE